MTREDVVVIGNGYVDIYNLRIGEFFMEDGYPEVFKILEIFQDWRGSQVYCIYKTREMKSNVKEEWFHDRQSPFNLLKVKPK